LPGEDWSPGRGLEVAPALPWKVPNQDGWVVSENPMGKSFGKNQNELSEQNIEIYMEQS